MNEKWNRGTSREVNGEWGTKETVDVSNNRLYHKFSISSRERYNLSSLQYVVKNSIICSNYRENVSKRVSKVVQKQYVETT